MLVSLGLVLLVGCSKGDTVGDSLDSIGTSNNSVSIGVVLSSDSYDNIKDLALQDVERLNSPVDIVLNVAYDNQDYTTGLYIAQSYCKDASTVGVVGHLYSSLCLSLKNVYEEANMPLVVPYVSSEKLLNDDEQYIYQTVSDMSCDSKYFTTISYHMNTIHNAVIVYSDTDYGNEFSKTLENTLTEDKIINVIDKVCSPNVYREFPECLEKWQSLDFDTVFLVGDVDLYQYYIPDIKQANPNANIFISSDIETTILYNPESYTYYDDVYQLSWSQYDQTQELQNLYDRYYQAYGEYPSVREVQIYDDIMVIAKAIANENVRTSKDLKNYLDTSNDIQSIFGDGLYFNENRIQNKQCYIHSYNQDGLISNSYSLTIEQIEDIWYNYYDESLINEYLKVGEYYER